jgi:hypothetical protein
VTVLQHFAFGAWLLLTAFIMAKLEVHIEGAAGWAQNLPTWRLDNALVRAIMGGRHLTGYHLYFHLLVLLLLHAPFMLGAVSFSLGRELRVIAFLILLWLLEDFFWFVINPAFGWRAFRRKHITWHHESWWGFMPREYWIAAPLGLWLYVISQAIQ